MIMKRTLILLLSLFILSQTAVAEPQYKPTPENLEAREQFQDMKFGIFIHWGVYAMLATGEWTMTVQNINYKEYAKLAGGFYPAKFDAAQWVSTVKDSGAKYICITSRHHDGFSMFDTKYSDYNIVKATPFGRDILKELAEECQKQDIKLHFYYSHIDWYRDDAPRGRTGLGTQRPSKEGNWESYYTFMNNQLTELLTNYGPIGAIWFDGHWDQDRNPAGFDWELDEQYALIHKLQPACLVANNHHIEPFAGEDIQIFERDLPGQNVAGLSGQNVSALPLETCQTMNGMWGYKITDLNYKSVKELVHYLVNAAGRNGNLLMNVGPQPDGEFPSQAVDRLRGMGEWMEKYGETIYGTRGGMVTPRDWGVTTQKGDRLFVHILELKDKGLFLPITDCKVLSATKFADGAKVRFEQSKEGVLLILDEIPTDIDYVVELKIRQ